jgi:hypothetical protein
MRRVCHRERQADRVRANLAQAFQLLGNHREVYLSMKFIRNPKPVTAQRSRARHLAHKRKAKPAPPPPDEVSLLLDHLIEAMGRLSPGALVDYLQWRKTHVENRHRARRVVGDPETDKTADGAT